MEVLNTVLLVVALFALGWLIREVQEIKKLVGTDEAEAIARVDQITSRLSGQTDKVTGIELEGDPDGQA